MKTLESLQISPQVIDEYLLVLAREGKAIGTIKIIHGTLWNWYQSLPAETYLKGDAIEMWERRGRENSLKEKTIHNQISMINQFLRYLEAPENFKDQRKDRRKKRKLLLRFKRVEMNIVSFFGRRRRRGFGERIC